jgi:hypothetical protein
MPQSSRIGTWRCLLSETAVSLKAQRDRYEATVRALADPKRKLSFEIVAEVHGAMKEAASSSGPMGNLLKAFIYGRVPTVTADGHGDRLCEIHGCGLGEDPTPIFGVGSNIPS